MCTKMNQLQVSKTKTILLGGNTYFITYVIILIVPYIFLCNVVTVLQRV